MSAETSWVRDVARYGGRLVCKALKVKVASVFCKHRHHTATIATIAIIN